MGARFSCRKTERPILKEYPDLLEWLLAMQSYTEEQLLDAQRQIEKVRYSRYRELSRQKRLQERP
jgi:hypothetical protein